MRLIRILKEINGEVSNLGPSFSSIPVMKIDALATMPYVQGENGCITSEVYQMHF